MEVACGYEDKDEDDDDDDNNNGSGAMDVGSLLVTAVKEILFKLIDLSSTDQVRAPPES